MEYKYKLNIYPMALLDMEQIYRYIAVELCNPTAATKQMQDIKKAFENSLQNEYKTIMKWEI